MDDTLWNHVEGARSKRPDLQTDAPAQQPMRAGIKPAQQKAPSSDQKRVRRQMAKNAAGPEIIDLRQQPGPSDADEYWRGYVDGEDNAPQTAAWISTQSPAYQQGREDGQAGATPKYATKTVARRNEENTMTQQHTEADLLAKMAGATTLAEQSHYAEMLNDLRNGRRDQIAAEASLDFAAMSADLRPSYGFEPLTATARMGSAAGGLDWLDDVVPTVHDDQKIATTMQAEATLWFESLWEPVKADEEEMRIQTVNAARRVAAQFGQQAEAAESVFVAKVAHLHGKTAEKECKRCHGTGLLSNGSPGMDLGPGFPEFFDCDRCKGTGKVGAKVAFDETQPGPYTMPNGSHHTPPSDKSTFDGLVNGENSSTDPKSTEVKTPSLSEGDQPEGDSSASTADSEVSDTDGGKYVKDKSQGTSYTDPLPSGGKTSSLFDRLRQSLAWEDPKSTSLTTETAPSLAEGDQPEGDKGSTSMDREQPAQDKSTQGDTTKDYLDGSTYDTSSKSTASLAEVGERVLGEAKTASVQTFGRALARMSSLDEQVAGFSGRDIVGFVLASGDVSEETREAIQSLAAEYQGGSPKEGDTAKCHKDGGAIQFFDGQWMHLKGTGSDHNDVHPATPREQAEKTSAKSDECPKCGAHMDDVTVNGDTLTAKCDSCGWSGSKKKASVTAAEGQTCGTCGDSIEKDPSGEDNSTWHHNNGEKHDHEAVPGGSKEGSAHTASESVEVAEIPDCDICKYDEGKTTPAAYDGKTVMGPWANMCESHFQTMGIGLGTGRGQRLVKRSTKVAAGSTYEVKKVHSDTWLPGGESTEEAGEVIKAHVTGSEEEFWLVRNNFNGAVNVYAYHGAMKGIDSSAPPRNMGSYAQFYGQPYREASLQTTAEEQRAKPGEIEYVDSGAYERSKCQNCGGAIGRKSGASGVWLHRKGNSRFCTPPQF